MPAVIISPSYSPTSRGRAKQVQSHFVGQVRRFQTLGQRSPLWLFALFHIIGCTDLHVPAVWAFFEENAQARLWVYADGLVFFGGLTWLIGARDRLIGKPAVGVVATANKDAWSCRTSAKVGRSPQEGQARGSKSMGDPSSFCLGKK